MLIVCGNGTDASNPNGSSTVAPQYQGTTYTSFEQVIFNVLDSAGIDSGLYCNPYVIEYPKPYGKNSVVTSQLVTTLDTCNCAQYTKLKNEIIGTDGSVSSLANINAYLKFRNRDTITTALYQGLEKCGQPLVYNCRVEEVACNPKFTPPCYGTVCDTSYTIPLATGQPLPLFLTCGFDQSFYDCFNCASFKSLDTLFRAKFNRGPVFTGTITNDTTIAYNDLFARFVNFKTGLRHTWQYYAERFNATSCGIGGISGAGTGLSICLDSKPLNDTSGLLVPLTLCQVVRYQASAKADVLYEVITQQKLADFRKAYLDSCRSITETFTDSSAVKEYHFTLYYYDQAGNLVKTVPPAGVQPIYRNSWLDSTRNFRKLGNPLPMVHKLVTRYSYNSLNQVVVQKTPDAGMSKFWYDRLGRLAISQNAQQLTQGNVYSYTLYDSLGRITQVGQLTGGSAMTDPTAKSTTSLQNWLNAAANSRNQITQTVYDQAYPAITDSLNQSNLRNRVSYTQVINQALDTYPATSTYYSYDVQGNVDTLLQDFGSQYGIGNAMNREGSRFKKVVYDFDLVSGKVNQVSYQAGKPDAYYHRYKYDAENRLTEVYSGRDSIMLSLFPEREALYQYYAHGPLARTTLGKLNVQGLDYIYTLQGWLKGINPAMGGTLTNGTDTTEPRPIAQDVFGFSLHYYKNDYKAIWFTPQSSSVLGALTTNAKPLYNGNIAAMAVNIPKLGNTKVYNYKYDQLNRLVSLDMYNGLNPSAGSFTPAGTTEYRERISYDPNGNILTYQRNGDAARLSMDNLTYSYTTGTNRLHKVTDAAADAGVGSYANYNDIRKGQLDSNYKYDAIGNLIRDTKDSISNISWTVYGKIDSITRNAKFIRYTYDAAGNRISKQTATDTTFYVRDATGNVMSVYVKPAGGSLRQEEVHLYGSSRLGIATRHLASDTSINLAAGFGTIKGVKFTRGEKLFELSNHLGNVLVTISDRMIQQKLTGDTVRYYQADVVSANDYYPFGMQMPGRKFSAGVYRYGFNGKENDNEVKGGGNAIDFGARVYDPRIGRWLSTDPLQAKYPSLTPYHFAGNNPTNYIDVDGKDTISINKTITRYSLSTGRPVWGGGVTYSIKVAKGEDVFYYNVYQQTVSATGVTISPVKSTQFYPNSAGQVIIGGSGLTESPSGLLPFMTHSDDDYTSLAKLAPPGLLEDLAKRNPEKYGSLGLHRAGLNIGEAGTGAAGGMLFFEGGGILKKSDYTVDPKKFDYFFGRVNSSAKNLERSTQNLNDLTALGIENNSDLIKVFDKAFYQGDIIKTTTSKFGTTVVKGAQVGENGAIHVGFFYEGGNMTATPKVSSIIPKLAPKK